MSAFLFVLFIGTIVRIFLIGNTGFVADISFWKSWSMAAVDYGIVWTSHNTNINYPPGFIYVLWLMGKIYGFFGDAHNYNDFWRENNYFFLLASKSIAILSDIAIAWLIYWFFGKKEMLIKLGANISDNIEKHNGLLKYIPLILASLFYLNPVVIMDSAQWGQVESFGMLFTIVAIILIFYKKPVLATAIFTVGALMKLQNIIYIPIYFLFILRYFDLRTLGRCLAAAAGAFFLVNLPFILARDMNQVLYLLTVNSDYFPWLSLNAFNVWWIVAGGKGMQITDKITALGVMNAKSLGLVIFSSFYFFSALLVLMKPTAKNFLLSLTFGIFSFFLLTTQSHERYSYPVLVFMLFYYPFLRFSGNRISQSAQPDTGKPVAGQTRFRLDIWDKYFFALYFLLTLGIFFNLHAGLILNYPNNGISILTRMTTIPLTIAGSYFLIFLFLLLIPFFLREISFIYLLSIPILLISGIFISHISYLMKGRVSLTGYKPVIMQQGYGLLQIDKSTDSSAGWKKWSRPSVDYMFYRKALGTHAHSYLVYDINGMFSRFSTDYGVDTEAGTSASVEFKIYGDDKPLFESKKMGRFDFPGHAEVSVKGIKKLGLVVTDAGDGIMHDHADWLNPMLYR